MGKDTVKAVVEEKVKVKGVEYNPRLHALKLTAAVKMGKYTWKKGQVVSVTRDGYDNMVQNFKGKFDIVKGNGDPL